LKRDIDKIYDLIDIEESDENNENENISVIEELLN